MNLAAQNDAFVAAWMRCLNTGHCRRLAARALRLPPTCAVAFETRTYATRINACLRTHGRAFVVKRFGDDECHWIFVDVLDGVARVFNTSAHYDMRDAVVPLRFVVDHAPCADLQTRRDCFCQTWSLVAALAAARRVAPSRSMFRAVAATLWRSRRFRECVLRERSLVVEEWGGGKALDENLKYTRSGPLFLPFLALSCAFGPQLARGAMLCRPSAVVVSTSEAPYPKKTCRKTRIEKVLTSAMATVVAHRAPMDTAALVRMRAWISTVTTSVSAATIDWKRKAPR